MEITAPKGAIVRMEGAVISTRHQKHDICTNCEGEGTVEVSNHPESGTHSIPCPICKGHRMVTKVLNVNIFPGWTKKNF